MTYFADSSIGTYTPIAIAVIFAVATLVNGRNNRWKDNYESERVDNQKLQEDIKKLMAENTELKSQNSDLTKLPNLEKLYELNHEILVEIKSLAKSNLGVSRATQKLVENK